METKKKKRDQKNLKEEERLPGRIKWDKGAEKRTRRWTLDASLPDPSTKSQNYQKKEKGGQGKAVRHFQDSHKLRKERDSKDKAIGSSIRKSLRNEEKTCQTNLR